MKERTGAERATLAELRKDALNLFFSDEELLETHKEGLQPQKEEEILEREEDEPTVHRCVSCARNKAYEHLGFSDDLMQDMPEMRITLDAVIWCSCVDKSALTSAGKVLCALMQSVGLYDEKVVKVLKQSRSEGFGNLVRLVVGISKYDRDFFNRAESETIEKILIKNHARAGLVARCA